MSSSDSDSPSKIENPGPVKDFAAGALLIREGEKSRKMFIVKEGRARVFKTYHGNRFTLAVLGPGEVFGELSFFDAEPRSASVEALTDVKLVVIGDDDGLNQIKKLPKWLFPVFKSISVRLREADQRLTVLQSIYEFEKKTFGTDRVAKTIYIDLLSFTKAVKLVYLREISESSECHSEKLLKELDDLLGSRHLGLKVFWKLLREQDFVDNKKDQLEGLTVLKEKKFDALQAFLEAEIKSERYLLLSNNAHGILRKIAGFLKVDPAAEESSSDSDTAHIPLKDLDLSYLPYYERGLRELEQHQFIKRKSYGLSFKPTELFQLFSFQSIIKGFDHTKTGLE